MNEQKDPMTIQIRNAHVHNLKHIDVDIPLNQIVGIAGVSGSGKSSLALGVLYAEGPRRGRSGRTHRRRRDAGGDRAECGKRHGALPVEKEPRCAEVTGAAKRAPANAFSGMAGALSSSPQECGNVSMKSYFFSSSSITPCGGLWSMAPTMRWGAYGSSR